MHSHPWNIRHGAGIHLLCSVASITVMKPTALTGNCPLTFLGSLIECMLLLGRAQSLLITRSPPEWSQCSGILAEGMERGNKRVNERFQDLYSCLSKVPLIDCQKKWGLGVELITLWSLVAPLWLWCPRKVDQKGEWRQANKNPNDHLPRGKWWRRMETRGIVSLTLDIKWWREWNGVPVKVW